MSNTQKFSGKVDMVLTVWPPSAVFKVVFGRNQFSQPNGRLSTIACHTYSEKYACKGANGLIRSNFSASYEASEFCWQIAHGSPQHLRPRHMK